MTKLEPDQGCPLHYAADLCKMLTEGIMKFDDVYTCCGVVTKADLEENVSSVISEKRGQIVN